MSFAEHLNFQGFLYLVHCSIFKIPYFVLSRLSQVVHTAYLLYHTFLSLSSLFFLYFSELLTCSLQSNFSFPEKYFKTCFSQSACLLYHIFLCLSSFFEIFFPGNLFSVKLSDFFDLSFSQSDLIIISHCFVFVKSFFKFLRKILLSFKALIHSLYFPPQPENFCFTF